MDIGQIILGLLGVVLLLTLVHFFLLLCTNSHAELDNLLRRQRDSDRFTFQTVAYSTLLFIGWLVFIYCGVMGLLSAVPDWGRLNEDGEFYTYKSYFSGLLSFLSIGVLNHLTKDIPSRM